MNKRYLRKSSGKIARMARLIAKGIDLFIALILSFSFYPLGILLGVTYLTIADSLQSGQSVGKKFMGFAVISLEDKTPCSIRQSVIRNLPLTIPLFLAIFPLWGVVFALLVGTPLILLELYLIFTLDSGSRLGDVMADTTIMSRTDDKVEVHNGKTVFSS